MTTQHFLALDIGGSAVKYAVMDSHASLLHKGKFTSPKASLDDFWLALDKVVLTLRQKYTLSGMAISTCGAVDCDSGVIHGASALPYIHGPNFKSLIFERYQLPAELENDACCAALAELWQGSAQQINQCCLVVIGSGIGGAVINNRQIQHGHQLHGGEFGYMLTGEKDGSPVTFSDMASTRALVESAAQAINAEVESLDGKAVFEAAEQGMNAFKASSNIGTARWQPACSISNIALIPRPSLSVAQLAKGLICSSTSTAISMS